MDAPVGSGEFAEADELVRLRRRAYGADADIVGDVAAQARLYELEVVERRPLTPVVDAARYGMICLFVAVFGQGPREGYSGEGCAPEGSDTAAELQHLGGDGFIRFVLQDDHVNVVYQRAADRSPPEGWQRAAPLIRSKARAVSPADPNGEDAPMDDSTSPMNGREHDPTALDAVGAHPPPDGERAGGPAPGGPADPPPPAALQNGRVRRILPWVIAAVAVLVAVIAIGVLVVDESSEPKPVAQLTPQTDPPEGAIPLDDETARNFGVTEADFVSYGSYGQLQIWSATTREGKPCLAMVAEGSIIMVRCAAPTLDPVADLDLPSNMLPPAPSGEPTFNIRFVLHDDVVDVYLAPNPEGGYY